MAMQNSECAMGMYPLKGNVTTDSPEITAQFAPRYGYASDSNGNVTAICHGCEQVTMVKLNAPRKGYFVFHHSSQQGSAPGHDWSQTHGRKGTPARERGRKQG